MPAGKLCMHSIAAEAGSLFMASRSSLGRRVVSSEPGGAVDPSRLCCALTSSILRCPAVAEKRISSHSASISVCSFGVLCAATGRFSSSGRAPKRACAARTARSLGALKIPKRRGLASAHSAAAVTSLIAFFIAHWSDQNAHFSISLLLLTALILFKVACSSALNTSSSSSNTASASPAFFSNLRSSVTQSSSVSTKGIVPVIGRNLTVFAYFKTWPTVDSDGSPYEFQRSTAFLSASWTVKGEPPPSRAIFAFRWATNNRANEFTRAAITSRRSSSSLLGSLLTRYIANPGASTATKYSLGLFALRLAMSALT
mmetsp:Transcript_6611/g.26974  ORF Transcript_6611/g.26974 Transcript_6611/m.26974 type:complete len:314 (+) Transcript_6611:957-1898(+)